MRLFDAHQQPERRRGSEEGPAVRCSSVEDVRRLQAAAGNRAVGRLLSRVPYDAKLAETASVVQPPLAWVKYPPNPLAMTRVQLFDALQLIDAWMDRGHNEFAAEMKALRERLRAYAKRVTTEAEFRTFRRYAKFPAYRLAEGYQRLVGLVAADRRELDFISLDALDEVVRDRFPGATWAAAARQWLTAHLREQDRRAERFSKLPWYQRSSFEKYEREIAKLPDPAHELWRELAWQWIDLRDAGQDRQAIEKRLVGELEAMYEAVLHEIDAAIQADCKARAPQTWQWKIIDNLSKAWGDPCKPWFSDGGHGWDELAHFGRQLRIKSDDDPFASVYYWVDHYSQALRLLTDPKAKLEEMQTQAASGLFLHWASIVALSPSLASRARGLAQVALRRAGGFLRHSMVGVQLAIGDAGSIAADAGAVKRPQVVLVEAGGRPPVDRGPVTPDPPGRPAPTAPAEKAPTTPAAKPPPAPAPEKPAPAAPAPATAPKTVPPPPPPAFVKARSLKHLPDPTKDKMARQRVRAHVIAALTRFRWGTRQADLPGGWTAIYDVLRKDGSDAAKQILQFLDVVWGGLRNPTLFADVLSEAWERAWLQDTSVETALIAMAEASSGRRAVWIPRSEEDALLTRPGLFFDLYAGQEAPFVDMPLLGDKHTALMHLIQDLVVDRAFAAAKIEMTSAKFRALLGRATSRLVPPKLGPVISTRGKNDLSLGDYVWQMTYDLYLNSRDHLPQPEAVGFELQKLFFMK